MFLYMTSVVYCRSFLHFMSSLFHNLKKTYPTPKVGVLNVEFELKLGIYRSLKSIIVSNESEKSFPQNAYSVQLPHIAGHSL